MSARALAVVTGTVILLLGLAALFYPERVMAFLGFTVLNAAHGAAVLGEVRATYGGLFAVMGCLVLFAAVNPVASRGRLLGIGLLWLGACGGRLFGVAIDGNPGLFGWLSVAFEGVVGTALVLAAQRAGAPDATAVVPTAAAPAASV